jgi:hypothetical protein
MLMQKWEAKLEAERLRLSTPDAIYNYLSGLGRCDRWTQNLDDEIVDTLLEMNIPLVSLGLARYVSSWKKIEHLWSRGPALRLALLSNRNAGGVRPDGELENLIAQGPNEELDALLTNPTLSPFILAKVISNDIGVAEDRWQLAVSFALRNERLTPYVK